MWSCGVSMRASLIFLGFLIICFCGCSSESSSWGLQSCCRCRALLSSPSNAWWPLSFNWKLVSDRVKSIWSVWNQMESEVGFDLSDCWTPGYPLLECWAPPHQECPLKNNVWRPPDLQTCLQTRSQIWSLQKRCWGWCSWVSKAVKRWACPPPKMLGWVV